QDAVSGGEGGELLEPVRPRAGEAVDEDDRRPCAELDRVDSTSAHDLQALVLTPVDRAPVGGARLGSDGRSILERGRLGTVRFGHHRVESSPEGNNAEGGD